ncbi:MULTISPECIES: ABC transporter permease [Ectothiorhodospira]|uniref:ABC transporter permease n=1 Tax=Ectothiorhodospira TaxID=1051 RepID=UPI001EE78F17|nr:MULTISPECIES: ABC transporter permease [Ectothiorhodospira]MCG5499544.1 ABC transporter permease [Ectothiorhodospira lacustris]MCG5514235.1 ABC transporter permease [Ectothiorhodospira shaposhnikovii]
MRTPWQVTWSVWRALFLREAVARTSGDRFAWFWMLAEPLAFVVVMVWIRSLIGRVQYIFGADFVTWLIVGLTAFFLFREGVTRSLGAVEANRGLFAYRQVLPVDPVLVRNVVEGILKTLVFLILLIGAGLLGHPVIPADPLGVLYVWCLLWLLGMGIGLVMSVAATLVSEIGIIVRVMMLPLLILSGVIIPLQTLPHHVQEVLLYNPIVHGLEALRLAFFQHYKTMPGVDLLYLWYWIIGSTALGLAMHLRFSQRLKAQ